MFFIILGIYTRWTFIIFSLAQRILRLHCYTRYRSEEISPADQPRCWSIHQLKDGHWNSWQSWVFLPQQKIWQRHMAGVWSPYLAPLPTPFPPTVRWITCWKALNLFALKSKETFHSFFNRGIVARRLSLVIWLSSLREYAVLHGPANKHLSERPHI